MDKTFIVLRLSWVENEEWLKVNGWNGSQTLSFFFFLFFSLSLCFPLLSLKYSIYIIVFLFISLCSLPSIVAMFPSSLSTSWSSSRSFSVWNCCLQSLVVGLPDVEEHKTATDKLSKENDGRDAPIIWKVWSLEGEERKKKKKICQQFGFLWKSPSLASQSHQKSMIQSAGNNSTQSQLRKHPESQVVLLEGLVVQGP